MKKYRGVSLIELMIALTLGLAVMAIVINIFISQKSSYALQENLARVQESGRFIIDFLARDLRMAGRPNALEVPTPSHEDPFPKLAEANAPARSNADNSQLDGIYTTMGITTTGDRLSIAYFPVEGTSAEDCLGNKLNTAASPRLDIHNTYFVAKDDQQLYCVGISPSDALGGISAADSFDVIADGISDLQIQYGLDTDGDYAANIYTSAKNVGDNEWPQVVSVRLAVLVASPNPTPSFDPDQTYRLLDADPVTAGSFNDRRLRRSFTTTVMIRNMQR